MSHLLRLVFVFVLIGLSHRVCRAQSQQEMNPGQRQSLQQSADELQSRIDQYPNPKRPEWSDAAIFAKGLAWALKYDREFSPADMELMEKAIRRGHERLAALSEEKPSWTNRQGKLALGYRSAVDGSVQPYGVIIPKGYDAKSPMRLDVVLHGSTRPVGMSELRFMARFDEGDQANSLPPEAPYIELHPLGRVENAYRWSGETDVFEAIEDVCRRYRIDRGRIVLRGMSMGASGTWHLGLKHPDRFVALGPYCGYVDTHKFSETPVPNFVRVGDLPSYQERGLHMLDSVDYAANAGIVPVVACMGEKDVFFQAHVLMGDAMRRERLTMTNLISPGTGHVIDPVTHAEQMRRIAGYVDAGRRKPKELRFVTWTLKYNCCHWLEILALDNHYARSEVSAKFQNDVLTFEVLQNVSRFAIALSELPVTPNLIRIGKSDMSLPDASDLINDRVFLTREDWGWEIERSTVMRTHGHKIPGVQGPIDDAFTSPFLCVRGTGQPWNEAVHDYSEASLRRFAEEWHHYFRGTLPIKPDTEVTEEDIRTRNLILFGDPGSNSLIAKCLPDLPLEWSKESVQLGGTPLSSTDHVPVLIAPNPLADDGNRYVVLNSGHTFRESELALLNYLLFPRWGDYAVLQIDPSQPITELKQDKVVRAGFFDENWRYRSRNRGSRSGLRE